MLLSLALPIVLSGVALFFASFLSWMVLKLHEKDWNQLPNEDEVMAAVAKGNAPGQSYMFPRPRDPEEMKTPAFQAKYDAGPRGTVTILPKVNMGQNLGLTFVYFLVVSFTIGYLASIAFPAGASFGNVFRFVFTAGLMAFLSAIVQHSIWFRVRIVGHVIESLAYAAITGAIFASLWPR